MIAEHAIDWSTQWREEGRREGRQEGEAKILLRMMNRRYGPLSRSLEQRIRAANGAQLLEWGERFVTAKAINEIFDDEDD